MPLSNKNLKIYHNKLTKEQKRLESEIAKFTAKPSGGQSDEDNAQLIEQFQENIELEKHLVKLLEDTKRALTKIKQGTYGICENCQLAINTERLEIYPATVICIDCESKRTAKRWWMVWKR